MSHETNQFNSEQNGIALNNQEGKSLDELAGEGQITQPHTEEEMPAEVAEAAEPLCKALDEVYTPGAVHDWLEKFQGKSVKELLENTPAGITANYDEYSKILTISDSPSLPTEAEIMKPVDFKTGCFGMRGDIELVKSKVKNWLDHPALETTGISTEPLTRDGEMTANLMLAYRALEDSRMRLGKAVQAYDGGKSCYPK